MIPLTLLLSILLPTPSPELIVKPYFQLSNDDLLVTWHTEQGSADWSVKYGTKEAKPESNRLIRAEGLAPHQVMRTRLTGLNPGAPVSYELRHKGQVVYAGTVTAPKTADQATTFVAAGDVGRGTPSQRKIAYQIHQARPDFVAILGDIVYPHGRMNEYRKYLYPMWASDRLSPSVGAPLLGNTVVVPVIGNHDGAYRNLATYPDGLAYYAYWANANIGPAIPLKITGSEARAKALDEASGGQMARMGSYAFTYGNTSWVVLDSNHYVNWRDPALRKWLDESLAKSRKSTWSIVAFHAPPYSSSKKHASDTLTRYLTDLIAKHNVDLVLNGHIHNYQRTYPLTGSGNAVSPDRTFDGQTQTKPKGTIYVISGAGGAELYDQDQPSKPETWKPFTARFKGGYSFSKVQIFGKRLTFNQIDANGQVIDTFRIVK